MMTTASPKVKKKKTAGLPESAANSNNSPTSLTQSIGSPPTPSDFIEGSGIHKEDIVIEYKLEAASFDGKWYPGKIVEVDATDNTFLVHFNGWNSRFDEWYRFTTKKVRPLTNTTPTKRRPRYKEGESILTKWIDSKYYRGKILKVKQNDKYDVCFEDGVIYSADYSMIKSSDKIDVELEFERQVRQYDTIQRSQERKDRLKRRSTPQSGCEPVSLMSKNLELSKSKLIKTSITTVNNLPAQLSLKVTLPLSKCSLSGCSEDGRLFINEGDMFSASTEEEVFGVGIAQPQGPTSSKSTFKKRKISLLKAPTTPEINLKKVKPKQFNEDKSSKGRVFQKSSSSAAESDDSSLLSPLHPSSTLRTIGVQTDPLEELQDIRSTTSTAPTTSRLNEPHTSRASALPVANQAPLPMLQTETVLTSDGRLITIATSSPTATPIPQSQVSHTHVPTITDPRAHPHNVYYQLVPIPAPGQHPPQAMSHLPVNIAAPFVLPPQPQMGPIQQQQLAPTIQQTSLRPIMQYSTHHPASNILQHQPITNPIVIGPGGVPTTVPIVQQPARLIQQPLNINNQLTPIHATAIPANNTITTPHMYTPTEFSTNSNAAYRVAIAQPTGLLTSTSSSTIHSLNNNPHQIAMSAPALLNSSGTAIIRAIPGVNSSSQTIFPSYTQPVGTPNYSHHSNTAIVNIMPAVTTHPEPGIHTNAPSDKGSDQSTPVSSIFYSDSALPFSSLSSQTGLDNSSEMSASNSVTNTNYSEDHISTVAPPNKSDQRNKESLTPNNNNNNNASIDRYQFNQTSYHQSTSHNEIANDNIERTIHTSLSSSSATSNNDVPSSRLVANFQPSSAQPPNIDNDGRGEISSPAHIITDDSTTNPAFQPVGTTSSVCSESVRNCTDQPDRSQVVQKTTHIESVHSSEGSDNLLHNTEINTPTNPPHRV